MIIFRSNSSYCAVCMDVHAGSWIPGVKKVI